MGQDPAYRSSKEKAYKLIKQAIITRAFAPGQFLSENELSNSFGVSRTPIREALQALEVEGFVTLIPHKGAQVAEISLKDLDEVYELRLVLERLAGQKLIERSNEICLQQMTDVLGVQTELAQRHQSVEFIAADREFHLALMRAAGNERLYRFYDSLRDHLLRLGLEAIQTPGRMAQVLVEHQAILAGLKEGSYAKFNDAITAHLSITKLAVGKNLPNLWRP
ncbi:MAG TPA: GntR family transcriptional regulator [Firmicutes bacterium]|jgi:DNA-binding GntR family transcriptional regulator|nr:hypothetical protein [Bacillota bacterium]MDK2926913.1 hypothetical protein [Bacillota bacterium]HHV56589.1 GntR family transcriptional regulator [Bacillota bacterium]